VTTTVVVAFITATLPQKKITAHCHCDKNTQVIKGDKNYCRCLLLLKHREDKTRKKTTKKTKKREGAYLQALALPFHFLLLLLASRFYPSVSSALS
jgi:hypothetical protein